MIFDTDPPTSDPESAYAKTQARLLKARWALAQEYGAMGRVDASNMFGLTRDHAMDKLALLDVNPDGLYDPKRIPEFRRRWESVVENSDHEIMTDDVARELWEARNAAEGGVTLPQALPTDAEGLVHTGHQAVNTLMNSDSMQPWHDPGVELAGLQYCLQTYVPPSVLQRLESELEP